MAKYIKQEMNDLNGKGAPQAYYRLQTTQHIDAEKFVKSLCHKFKGISEGDVQRILISAADHLADLLAEGYSVSIGDIGTFKATIGLEKGKEMDALEGDEPKRNARSLCLNGVNFRADKQLVLRANKQCKLERAGVARLHQSPYNKEERLQLALDYLGKHHAMKVVDYMKLTEFSRSSAANELRDFSHDPTSDITFIGRGSSKTYIKRPQGE